MAFIPREYQTEAVMSLWSYFQTKSGNPLVAMPTGTGKSVVIAEFLHGVYKQFPNQKIMVVTHVKELIQQNYEKLMHLWPTAPAGIYSAGLGHSDTRSRIIFAGIMSIAKRAEVFKHVDLVMVDEAHLISPAEETYYNLFFTALKAVNPNLKVIGLTATPWRAGVGKIEGAGLFTDTCFDLTSLHAFNKLIDDGYLLPLIPKSPKTLLDVTGVHMRGGDFIAGELQAAVDRDDITSAALTEMLEHAGTRNSWLIFCTGVEHSINTSKMLNEMGVPCKAIHSKMTSAERDTGIADWKSGKLKAVTNNNCLTTGVDHPMLDFIGILRPTASTILWIQMLGRGTRPVWPDANKSNWPMWGPGVNPGGFDLSVREHRLACIELGPKKNCLVLDFAGNTKRLGPINDPVIPRRKGDKVGGEAPVKLCPCCSTWNHASARFCFVCNSEFIQQVKIKQSAGTDALIKKDDPIVDVFKVDHVTYELYHRAPKPPMLKVAYYCGLRRFNEFVCFEHDGYAKHLARLWWKARTDVPFPETSLQAISSTSFLKVATHLRIHVNLKYPTILSHCYDGTAFGSQTPDNTQPTSSDLTEPEIPAF